MRLGIMQPYFFPYLGYFALIKYCNRFIFFDTPQYIRHGWCNRNRILKQDGTPSYITVPVKKSPRETPINKILIDNSADWRGKIFGQLNIYRKSAPNYDRVIEFLRGVLGGEYESLSRLCIDTTKAVCSLLGIRTEFDTLSEMDIVFDEPHAPDEWCLNITKALDYPCYVNPPGGMSFYDRAKYERSGIKLEFLAANLHEYSQMKGHEFVPGLSVIDALMFLKPDEVSAMLDDYSVM
ncbi:MAG: WbqC family protein [Synergistaceae bacterium]|nr:WbqC family protein [Synergistaceae bacterium]